jgi:aldose 1-epimerase
MPEPIFKFLPLGAIIQNFYINGTNIVQGFPNEEQYETHNTPFYGETIGRVANRIAGAKIENLNGETVLLTKNDGENTLHGGKVGWGKKLWAGPMPVATRKIPGFGGLIGAESLMFTLRDLDGNEGFPGTLDVSVVYTTGTQRTDDGKEVRMLGIEYQAVLADDEDVQETVVNITNHSYVLLTHSRQRNADENPTDTSTCQPTARSKGRCCP